MRVRRARLARQFVRLVMANGATLRRIMGHDWFRLEGRKLIPCLPQESSLGVHIEGGDTTIGGARISTVCLGFDHGFYSATRQVFETMVFLDGQDDIIMCRYATYDEAEAGHAHYCALMREEADKSERIAAATLNNLTNTPNNTDPT